MCTVTLTPVREPQNGRSSSVARLACNRDESPSRAIARPPIEFRYGDRIAVHPVDPDSGGTWVALNGAGLAFALLNINLPGGCTRRGAQSRGLILPGLLICADLNDVAARLAGLEHSAYSPFRVIATNGDSVLVSEANGPALKLHVTALDRPMLWTSSGLGDSVVQSPREALFREWIRAESFTPARQDAFHRHRWADRPELSVMMQRDGARTVSYTTIDLESDRARLTYHGELNRAHVAQTLRIECEMTV